MTEKSKRRIDELRYSLERNNFILSILTNRVLVCLHNDGVGEPDSQTSIIEKISPQYVNLIRSVRNRFPNDSAEDLAQELYNMIYIEDNGYKRDYSHFRVFDEDLLNEWHILREKQKQLFSERVALDSILADAQHAYYSVHGKDIEWHEIEQKTEQKQQEEAQETEPDDEDDTKEMLKALNERVAQDEIICRMYKDGVIPEEVALKYTGGDLEHESFMKLVRIYTDDEKTGTEVDVDSWCETQKKEHQMEIVAQMVAGGAITPEVAFEYMNRDNDFHDYDNFLRILDIWTEKEAETDE